MTTLEQIADQITTDLVRGGVWLTIPHRKLLWSMIVGRVRPLVIEQASLPLTDADKEANAEQAMKILALLKERRSEGVTTAEMLAIAAQYNARIFELRRPPHNYKIICTKEGFRRFRFRLTPEDW